MKVLYDYEANAPGELTVKEDDVLLVFGQEDAWLVAQIQAEGGKAGYVPENYCEVRKFRVPLSNLKANHLRRLCLAMVKKSSLQQHTK